jgi:hypothetical protein
LLDLLLDRGLGGPERRTGRGTVLRLEPLPGQSFTKAGRIRHEISHRERFGDLSQSILRAAQVNGEANRRQVGGEISETESAAMLGVQ